MNPAQDHHLRPSSPASAFDRSTTGHISKAMVKSIQKLFRRPGPRRPPNVCLLPVSSQTPDTRPDVPAAIGENHDRPSFAAFRPLPQVPSSLMTTQAGESARHSLQVVRPRNMIDAEQQARTSIKGMADKFRHALTKLKLSKAPRESSHVWTGTGDLPSRLFLDDFEYVERPIERLQHPPHRPHTADEITTNVRSSSLWSEIAHAMQPSQPVEHTHASHRNGTDRMDGEGGDAHVARSNFDVLRGSAPELANEQDKHRLNKNHALRHRPALEHRPTLADLDAKDLQRRLEGVQQSRLSMRAPTPLIPVISQRPVATVRDSLAAKMLDLDVSKRRPAVVQHGHATTSEESPVDDALAAVNSPQTGIRRVTNETFAHDLPGRHIHWPPPHEQQTIEAEMSFLSNVKSSFVMPQLGHPHQPNDVMNSGEKTDLKAAPTSSSCTYSSEEEDATTMDSRLMDVFSRIQEWRARVAATTLHTFFAPSATNSHLDDLLHVSHSSDLTSVSRRVEIGKYVGDGLRVRNDGGEAASLVDDSSIVLREVEHDASSFGNACMRKSVDGDRGKQPEGRSHDDKSNIVKSDVKSSLVPPSSSPQPMTPIELLKAQSARQPEPLPARISFQGSPDDLIKLFKGSFSFEKDREEDHVQHRDKDLLIDPIADHVPLIPSTTLPYGTSHIRELSAKDSQALMEIFERNTNAVDRTDKSQPQDDVVTKATNLASTSRTLLEEALNKLSAQIDRMTDVADLHRAFLHLQQDLLRLVPDETGQTAILQRLKTIEQILFVPA